MAVIYYANGKAKKVEPKNGTDFTLAEMKKIVGGHIEIAQAKEDDHILVINEEGKLNNLKFNFNASLKFKYYPHDFIVGDALYCKTTEVK